MWPQCSSRYFYVRPCDNGTIARAIFCNFSPFLQFLDVRSHLPPKLTGIRRGYVKFPRNRPWADPRRGVRAGSELLGDSPGSWCKSLSLSALHSGLFRVSHNGMDRDWTETRWCVRCDTVFQIFSAQPGLQRRAAPAQETCHQHAV